MPRRGRILQEEVRWRARECGSRVPPPLVPDGDAPRTQQSHPSTPRRLGPHNSRCSAHCSLDATLWAAGTTKSGPSTPTTRAPSVLVVTGWGLIPRTAVPSSPAGGQPPLAGRRIQATRARRRPCGERRDEAGLVHAWQVQITSPLQNRAVLLKEARKHCAIRAVQPRQNGALNQLGTLLMSARNRDVAITSNGPVGPFLKLKRVVEFWLAARERHLQLRLLVLPACVSPPGQSLSELVEETARLARVGDRAAEEGGELRRQWLAQWRASWRARRRGRRARRRRRWRRG